MEEVYKFVKETVERVAEAQFQNFKTMHEYRLRDASSPHREINKAALLDVDREEVVILKPLCTREQIMDMLEMMDQADIDKLAQRKGTYGIIIKEFDLWIKCLVNTKKQEYLHHLLTGEDRTPKPFKDFLNISSDEKKDQLIEILDPICNQGSGKILAMIVIAMEETGLLPLNKSKRSLFISMNSIFPNIGKVTGFQDQYRELNKELGREVEKRIRVEIDRFKKVLQPFL